MPKKDVSFRLIITYTYHQELVLMIFLILCSVNFDMLAKIGRFFITPTLLKNSICLLYKLTSLHCHIKHIIFYEPFVKSKIRIYEMIEFSRFTNK